MVGYSFYRTPLSQVPFLPTSLFFLLLGDQFVLAPSLSVARGAAQFQALPLLHLMGCIYTPRGNVWKQWYLSSTSIPPLFHPSGERLKLCDPAHPPRQETFCFVLCTGLIPDPICTSVQFHQGPWFSDAHCDISGDLLDYRKWCHHILPMECMVTHTGHTLMMRRLCLCAVSSRGCGRCGV